MIATIKWIHLFGSPCSFVGILLDAIVAICHVIEQKKVPHG